MTENQTIIVSPETGLIEKENSPIVEGARALVVSNLAEHAVGQEALKRIATASKKVEELFKDPKALAHKAHKAITQAEAQLLEPLKEARRIVSDKLYQYEEAERRRAEEEARQKEEEARRAEEERQLLDAVAAEESGDKEGAAAILEEETVVPTIAPQPAVAKTKGVSGAVPYAAEVTDLKALVKWVAARCDKDPGVLAYLKADTVALNKVAGAQKANLRIDGVKAMPKPRYAVRGA